MEKPVIKGIMAPAAAVVLSKLFLVVDWLGFGAVMYIYFPLTAVSAAIIMKGRSMRDYLISAGVFAPSLICFMLISTFADRRIFRLIFGADAEMSAGDGLEIIFLYAEVFVACVIGMAAALIITAIAARRKGERGK